MERADFDIKIQAFQSGDLSGLEDIREYLFDKVILTPRASSGSSSLELELNLITGSELCTLWLEDEVDQDFIYLFLSRDAFKEWKEEYLQDVDHYILHGRDLFAAVPNNYGVKIVLSVSEELQLTAEQVITLVYGDTQTKAESSSEPLSSASGEDVTEQTAQDSKLVPDPFSSASGGDVAEQTAQDSKLVPDPFSSASREVVAEQTAQDSKLVPDPFSSASGGDVVEDDRGGDVFKNAERDTQGWYVASSVAHGEDLLDPKPLEEAIRRNTAEFKQAKPHPSNPAKLNQASAQAAQIASEKVSRVISAEPQKAEARARKGTFSRVIAALRIFRDTDR
ncbi:MAG: hypothetical protein H6619_04145 [Deltaproteobacteria bacterium]|nr:hypothetical protein [Deltaproteobacteria bacterium]